VSDVDVQRQRHDQQHPLTENPMRYIALLSFVLAACATPKVMVDQEFTGNNRTTKLIIQKTSDATFDTYVRICTLLETGEERDCADTLLMSNVTPGSVY